MGILHGCHRRSTLAESAVPPPPKGVSVTGLEGRCSKLDHDCDQIDVSLNTPVVSTIDAAAAPSVPLFFRGYFRTPFLRGVDAR